MNGIRIPKGLYQEIEKKVVDLYYEQNISTTPIDPREIIANRGYILRDYSFLTIERKTQFRIEGRDAISFYYPEKRTFCIVYDSDQSSARIRFTLMHEIGHIDMGHKEESLLAKKIADYYAAYALAPSPLIYLYGCEDYADIEQQFGLSAESAYYRFQRYSNWLKYGGKYYKDYEERLVDLFR